MDTINLEPNWPGMRTWVLALAHTDPRQARKVAAAMGSEAPTAVELEQACAKAGQR